ncbi:GNAT family N-acetyltransferase [Saxibacter everestensis]|uniref:GNAT family N-acetyltransferase n=1 Tax=Saxibacter everestensis TaxID=2909229 RepID=A0ABY8QP12_9MICO|nr:GNAT family N-acetyltransferase [Brevibacteriaceae bacterium ZFBP1038]
MTHDTAGAPSSDPQSWKAGTRVVVRYSLTSGGLSDALGTVTANSAEALTVHTRSGDISVPHTSIVLGHEVPPAPERRGAAHRALGPSGLQRIFAATWRPRESAWLHADNVRQELAGAEGEADESGETRERGWLLRAAGGYTSRANSALALDDPGMPPGPTIEAVSRWYSERSLTPAVCVFAVQGEVHPAEAALDEAGWQSAKPTVAMTAASIEVAGGAIRPADLQSPDWACVLSDEPSDDFYAGLGHPTAEGRPTPLHELLTCAPQQMFLTVSSVANGQPAGIARLAISQRWAVLSDVNVNPVIRRGGVGTLMVRLLAAHAYQQGFRSLALQVEEQNEAALRAYQNLGFTEHHRYHYRVKR